MEFQYLESSDLQVHAPVFIPRCRNDSWDILSPSGSISDLNSLIKSPPKFISPIQPIKRTNFLSNEHHYLFGQKSQSRFTNMFQKNNETDSKTGWPFRMSTPIEHMLNSRQPMKLDQRSQPYPCAGCKLNWMTGNVKEHECNFTDQYTSGLNRTDFQAPLPRFLTWLVEVLASNIRYFSLVSVATAIGVTQEVISKTRNQNFKSSYARARYIFLKWALNKLSSCLSEKEVVINLINDLCESDKIEVVLLIWSKGGFNFD